ncbi:hypothetical protein [Nonomuraea basaltis]|uniref:hypothetical protein n=1 Tax=Nonomuraea basaltis TaxID=2495887 RepID=UPI00110C582F|nr:hypothetical protein [Nonomuraea basaltis]TMR88004.1 hypothetical protein EJK15_68630 [Nonomuraea basaltis]
MSHRLRFGQYRSAGSGTDRMPDTTTALDVIDFVALHIDKPSFTGGHTWGFAHPHYSFDTRERDPFIDGPLTPGQEQFQDDIEQIFRRTGIAFTLGSDMRVHRLGPPKHAPRSPTSGRTPAIPSSTPCSATPSPGSSRAFLQVCRTGIAGG